MSETIKIKHTHELAVQDGLLVLGDKVYAITCSQAVLMGNGKTLDGTIEDLNQRISSKQARLIPGKNITIGPDNTISAVGGDIYIVDYAHPNWQEAKAALQAGKALLMKDSNDFVYFCTDRDEDYDNIQFLGVSGNYILRKILGKDNTWESRTETIEHATNKKQTLSPTNRDDYPSSKAVADYIKNGVGKQVEGLTPESTLTPTSNTKAPSSKAVADYINSIVNKELEKMLSSRIEELDGVVARALNNLNTRLERLEEIANSNA